MQQQVIKFEIYDSDSSKKSLKEHDFLGRVETTMAQVVSAPRKQFVAVLKGGPKNEEPKIFVDVEEVTSGGNDLVQLQFSGLNLDKKDIFPLKSDPFYVLSKCMPSGEFSIVHRSEVIPIDLNPNWKALDILVGDLCNNDYEMPLKIRSMFQFKIET